MRHWARPWMGCVAATLVAMVRFGVVPSLCRASPPEAAHPTRAIAQAVAVTGVTGTATEFMLDMTAGVQTRISTLAHPYRVILDLPGVTFDLDPAAGQSGSGLVSAFRFGALSATSGRVVLDTAGPVAIESAVLIANSEHAPRGGVRLIVRLRSTDARSFGEGTGSAALASAEPDVKPGVYDERQSAPRMPSKPVIMIDPGHGGIDPGAIGASKTTEKSIVLGVARQLKATLEAAGRYEVRLTRGDDTFIALDRRVDMSKAARADVFISLHADAIDDGSLARSVRGASVYTLSERASDEQARLMAEKENAADLAAGLEQLPTENADEIKGILFDLLSRETAMFSHVLSHKLVLALGRSGGLAREPERAAGFRVLKQVHAPSALIELGFLSNPTDEQQMVDANWQRGVAQAIASAIEGYLADRSAGLNLASDRSALGRLPP